MSDTTTELIAWLRALPVGTVLLDDNSVPWMTHPLAAHVIFVAAHPAGGFYHSHRDSDMRDLCKHAPFRVLHTPTAGA